MANADPAKARQARRTKRQAAAETAGTVSDLRLKLWRALAVATDMLDDPGSDAASKLKALHALTQASGVYLKVVEVGELEARLNALEAQGTSASEF